MNSYFFNSLYTCTAKNISKATRIAITPPVRPNIVIAPYTMAACDKKNNKIVGAGFSFIGQSDFNHNMKNPKRANRVGINKSMKLSSESNDVLSSIRKIIENIITPKTFCFLFSFTPMSLSLQTLAGACQ